MNMPGDKFLPLKRTEAEEFPRLLVYRVSNPIHNRALRLIEGIMGEFLLHENWQELDPAIYYTPQEMATYMAGWWYSWQQSDIFQSSGE